MEERTCILCGKAPADGWASVGDDWLCHGDEGDPTCYMLATHGFSLTPGQHKTLENARKRQGLT